MFVFGFRSASVFNGSTWVVAEAHLPADVKQKMQKCDDVRGGELLHLTLV